MRTNKSNGQLTAQINLGDHKKSGFDLSNNVLGTGKIGRIIPTRALHVMPNDTIKADSKVAVQFEPLAVPILANMEVKQEHFYCPYNIVWKNWDKFISGGEKMDYRGVVPNVSIRDIIRSVNVAFTASGPTGFSPLFIPLKTGSTITGLKSAFYLDFSKIPWFNHLDGNPINTSTIVARALDYVGEKYAIKDLLKPCYESLDVINSINHDNEPLFGVYTRNGINNFYDFIKDNVDDNKYLKTIAKSLYEKHINDDIIVPLPKGIEYILAMYEFYKPFYGIGSNIDYLNMGRITKEDFLYIVLGSIYRGYLQEGEPITDVMVMPFVDAGTNLPMSVLNLRANYNIWYNNYRDILLESDAFEPVDIDAVTDEELFILLVPRQRCWEKDAFTTALDNPGTGNVGVATEYSMMRDDIGFDVKAQRVDDIVTDPNGNQIYEVSFGGESWRVPSAYLTGINPQESTTNVADSYGFSLYQLDAAQRAQKWLQKALFYGNRISDFYYMHFGVRFLDARLRLPELLTSSSELVKLDVVMNNTNITTEANGEIYQSVAGDRAAYASAYDNGNSFERFCEEHGVIMSYLTIMPQVTYAYGMNRDYSRLDQFDFAFSEFATLGMDAVYDSEITTIGVDLPYSGHDVKVFGYQGKYYDYKAKHSEEHGELLDSQDMYTFARKFNMYDPEGHPKLNYEFVHCFPDLDMFVVDSSLSDYFRYDIRHSTAAERNLPSQSIYI